MTLTLCIDPLLVQDIEELRVCAAREARMRESVYPRLIESGRMTADKADSELSNMRAIAALLELLRDAATGQMQMDF